MKRSVLSKGFGVSVICFNLAMPLTSPAFAQSNNTSGSSNTGTSTAPSDANVGTSTAPSNANTGASTAPSSSSTSSSSSSSSTFSSPTDSSTASGDTSASPSTSPSSAATNAAPAQKTDPKNQTDWGWLGWLGLLGLAGLLRKQPRPTVNLASNRSLHTDSDGDRLHDAGAAQAGAGASNLWEELKSDVSGFQERRAREKEAKRIKDALGRPIKRVILDRQDKVILNVGDLVTNQSIERARSADMLDVLLDSVDDQDPEITNEERSAPVHGEASLEERHGDNTPN